MIDRIFRENFSQLLIKLIRIEMRLFQIYELLLFIPSEFIFQNSLPFWFSWRSCNIHKITLKDPELLKWRSKTLQKIFWEVRSQFEPIWGNSFFLKIKMWMISKLNNKVFFILKKNARVESLFKWYEHFHSILFE